MSRKQKLIKRLKSKPRDMTFDEVETLLLWLGYSRDNQGKTSGSRIKFYSSELGRDIGIHKPHPKNILKLYQILQIIEILESEGLI
ncbi:MAG: type II toxin-antitoxin system HicA family toxin [Defluviitaleaceae bacterium]|nr:type II toxin-antitoxin system HicA family toxin [Defluviitaleaceae bacterium]